MNVNRDPLDEAIDATAARMTAVAENDNLALRIVSALPERSAWSLRWLMPRLAVGALATIAIVVVLRPFADRSPKVLRTENARSVAVPSIVEPASVQRRTAVEPAAIFRRTIVERPLNDRRTESDHELSLPALDAVASLEDEALTVTPLEIADLPLTSDFPR